MEIGKKITNFAWYVVNDSIVPNVREELFICITSKIRFIVSVSIS